MIRVGRITRLHVLLEGDLRWLFDVLGAPTPVRKLAADGVSRLIDQCRALAGSVPLGPDVRDPLLALLSDMVAVNAERNRVVHEIWLTSEDGETWISLGVSGGKRREPQTISIEILDDLIRRMIRLQTRLFGAIQTVMFDSSAYPEPMAILPRNETLALLRDEFDQFPDGSFKPHT